MPGSRSVTLSNMPGRLLTSVFRSTPARYDNAGPRDQIIVDPLMNR